MATTIDRKNTIQDTTPVYAVVGIADLVVEKAREAGAQAEKVGDTLAAVDPMALQADLVKQVQDAPAAALNKALELAGKVQEQYSALAARGEHLVERIRAQRATQELIAQVDQTVSVGKGAVTTMRHAVANTEASAKATATTARHQAAKVADVLNDVVAHQAASVKDSAETVADAAADATAATTTAAKRTRTTARKGAKATGARAKATTTTARKAAPRARKATAAAAEKVGD